MDTADESGNRSPEGWLLDTLSAASRVVTEAESAVDLGRSLPVALTDLPENKAAWIGQPGRAAGTVTIRAGTAGVPETITEIEESTTRAVLDPHAVRTLDAEKSPEYEKLREAGAVPEAAAAVAIPVPALHRSAVLHLYTDGDTSHRKTSETFDRLADLLVGGFESQKTDRELTRERERLEALRSLVSHDLGNPINVAAGRLDLVGMECESEHIEHVESAIEQIEALAEEGTLFVKAGRKVEEESDVDLATVAGECWELIDESDASLSVEPLTVYAEPERLRMLLNQLFENAVVHTAGSVSVTVGPLPNRRGFYVEDDGPGIPEDEREYVFDRGYTTVSEREGHGLALVEEIAGALGWAVELGDAEGTRVEIRTEVW